MSEIEALITRLRVPGLPYPVGSQPAPAGPWNQRLCECWSQQVDSRVVDMLREQATAWSVRQVNAAYLADRIMDVLLQTSGFHPSLVRRVARLRFYLAWRLEHEGEIAIDASAILRRWLDHLVTLRGWSDDGGRSSRRLLQRLDALIPLVQQAFADRAQELNACLEEWIAGDADQEVRTRRIRERLLETEQGAAKQRAAEMYASNRVARALQGRQLPPAIVPLIDDQWQSLLRQIAFIHGSDSDLWRRTARAMEWLVWALDPALSGDDRNRLYQVAEELPERLAESWLEVFAEPVPSAVATVVQEHLVARVRGQLPDLVGTGPRDPDPSWLEPRSLPTEVEGHLGQWLVRGEGEAEQRSWLFTYLESTGEVLWTNGQGVKQGLEPAESVAAGLADGTLQTLPEALPFEEVVISTVAALGRVLGAQEKQRQAAIIRAREEAELLRQRQLQAQLEAEAAVAARAREAEQDAAREVQAEQEANRLQLEAEQVALEREQESQLRRNQELVDGLRLGAWIELKPDDSGHHESGSVQNSDYARDKLRFKLAVRMNATGKLVFVDRLGLNQRVLYSRDLAELIQNGGARILDKGAEFDDTLSRVVGRLRVGR